MSDQHNNNNEPYSLLKGRCILAIDQDEIGQFILKKCLGKCYTNFEVVADLHEAVGKLSLSYFDFIILNIEKFDPSYRETISQLRSISGPSIIIGLTTLLDEQFGKELVSLGVSGMLQKPIDTTVLSETMVYYLNLSCNI